MPVLLTVPKSANTPRWPNARLLLKYRRARSRLRDRSGGQAAGPPGGRSGDGPPQRQGLFIETWGAEDIGAELVRIGISGSPTKVKKVENVVLAGRNLKMFASDDEGVRDLVHGTRRREDVRLNGTAR